MSTGHIYNELEDSLDNTIRRSELKFKNADIDAQTFRELLDNPALKILPVVKELKLFIQAGLTIRDTLFTRKMIAFLVNLEDVDTTRRQKLITKVDISKKYRLRVGEKLLYLIDRCNDYETSEIIAKLFTAWLKNQIEYDEFIISSELASNLSILDLKWFIENYSESININELRVPVHSGLYTISTDDLYVNIQQNDDYKALREGANPLVSEVSGGGTNAEPSRAGSILYKILK